MKAKLLAGVRVRLESRSEWGIGQILDDEQNGMVKVLFEDAGLKNFKTDLVQFVFLSEGESKSDYLNELLKAYASGAISDKAKFTSVSGAIDKFRKYFPLGFNDPEYLSKTSERQYKLDASDLLQNLLNREKFSELKDSQDYDEICSRVKKLVNKTNLVSPFEKINLGNQLALDKNKKLFADSLFDLLYANSLFQVRFEKFCAILKTIDAATWPIATYFCFLSSPQNLIFLKPEVTQSAAKAFAFELNYKTELNWLTYTSVLRLAELIRNKLISIGSEDFVPRDMIDVQSFIWVSAPGYK